VEPTVAALEEHAAAQIGVDPLEMVGMNRQPSFVLLTRRRNNA
jgi:hypothetical protein